MAEELIISSSTDKSERYQTLLPQIEALISSETDIIANLSNVASALKYGMDFFWVGFYLVKSDELVLGPFQGPVACTRIKKGKGACGVAWERNETILVPDVDKFPDHIACSTDSKSEIVVPLVKNEQVVAVLDVDSDQLDDFDDNDRLYLGRLCEWVADRLH